MLVYYDSVLHSYNYSLYTGTILRQQSSEELLESTEKPEWSKAQLEDVDVERMYNYNTPTLYIH